MPIRPENRERYPKNWRVIAKYIRIVRARNKCEWCGVPNKAVIERCGDTYEIIAGWAEVEKAWRAGRRITRIVLTVAHLNHRPEDCRPQNLAAVCQRCHLRYDKRHHIDERRRNLASKQGTLSLFDT